MKTDVDSLKIDIHNFLSRSSGSLINKCFAVYSRIIKADSLSEQVDLFKYTCEFFGTRKATEEINTPQLVTEERRQELILNYGKYVNGLIDYTIKQKMDEDKYYGVLWESIFVDKLVLNDDEKKAFALYYILIDKRIPYFKLGESVAMSNEDYAELINKLTIKRQKIRFVLSSPMASRTERAGYLLEILDEYSGSPKERAVLMAYIIDSLRKKSSDIERQNPELLLSMLLEQLRGNSNE
jgi:hypothetical protein